MSVFRRVIVKRLSGLPVYNNVMRKQLLLFSVTLALLTGLLAFQRRAPFDGRLIALRSDRDYPDKSRSALYVMSTDGQIIRRIIDKMPNAYCLNVDFSSPDADWHVFRGDNHLVRVSNGGFRREAISIESQYPPYVETWSQDGRILILSTSEKALFAYDGHETIQLIPDGTLNQNWGWSPDGEWIYYTAYDENIYRVRRDATGTEQLSYDDNPKRNQGWSPDGQWLYYISWDAIGSYQLHRMNAGGTRVEQLLDVQQDWMEIQLWDAGDREFGPLILTYQYQFEPFDYWDADDPWLVMGVGPITYKMRPDGSDVTAFGYTDPSNPYLFRSYYERHPDGYRDRCTDYDSVSTLEASPTGRGWVEDSGDDWMLMRVPTNGPNGWELYWVEDGTAKNITNHPGDDEFVTWMTGEEQAFSIVVLLGLTSLMLITTGVAFRR